MKKILMALALMPLMALAIDVKITGTGMKHLLGWGYYIEYTIDGVAYRSDTAPQAMNLVAWRNMSEDDQKKTIDAYGWQSGRRMEDFGYAGAQEIADKINEESGWTALWDKFKENLINRDYPTLAAIFDKDDTRSAYFEENYTPHWQSGVEFVWNDEMLQLLEEQHLVWQWSYESYLAIKKANEKRLQTGVQALSGDLIALIVDKVLVPRITMENPIELGFKYGIRKEVLGAILDYANSITGAGDALLEQVLTERVTCESGAEIVAKLTDMVNMNLHMMNLCKKRLIENRSAMESLGVQNAVANEKAKKELDAKVAAEKIENEERLVEMTASDEPDAATLAVNSSLSAEIGNLQARLARDTDDEEEDKEELERQIAQKKAERSAYNQGMHSELVVQYEAWVNRYNDAVKEWLEKRPAVKRISSSYAEAIACGYTFTLGPEVDPTVEPEINAYIASLREYINDYPLWRAEGLKLYGQFQDELEPIVMKHAALEGVGPLTASVGVGAINVVGDDVVLSVTVAKKGKVKVSGTVDGAKVSATSQLLVGAEACCIPVVIAKKAKLAFSLWLMGDGTVEVHGADFVTSGEDAASPLAGKAGALKPGAAFRMDGAALEKALPGLLADYLPDGLAVGLNKTKWVVEPDEKGKAAKAGKVAINKKTGEIDEAKLGANPSALKLAYTAKSGSFKGSFKAYTLDAKGKVKSYTVNVTGVVVGNVGYGTAALKKPAVSIPITVERL